MRRLIASTFASLDGVMQAPGGPEEDPTGGFTAGGWMFAHADDGMDISEAGFDGKGRELVLGRRTYQIFERQPDPDAPGRVPDRRVRRLFPVVLGRGKRLFGEGARPAVLRLVRSRVSKSGAVMSTYVPDGDIRPGTFESTPPSELELARRERMSKGTW
ncbi:MAG: hypothetical protein WCS72_15865 [Deltaproteobacteria bacterium]